MKNLSNVLESLDKNIKTLLPEINKEIDSTIKFLKNSDYIKRSKSSLLEDKEYIKKINNKIELNLDYLLNPYIENEFNTLINYWEIFNPESANDYKKTWKDMYE